MVLCLALKKLIYHENHSQWYKRAFFFLLLHTIPLNGCAITHLSFNDGHLGCLKCFDVYLKFFIDIAKLSFTETV